LKLDLTVGQRLAIGFAFMLLLLVALLIRVGQAHEASATAQTIYSRHIAPLGERAATLERNLYEVAISARNYLISPDDDTLTAYRSVAEATRDSMRTLEDAPKSGASEALYRDLAPLVRAYLVGVDRAVEERGEQRLGNHAESALNRARERAISAIHDFSHYQAASTRAALAGMAFARDRVTRDIRLGSAFALLWFLGIAFATARAVSKPTRELVEVAQGFETGFWKPALAWAAVSRAESTAAEPRDEMAKLRRALGAAAAALEKREQRLYADAQVASATAASLDVDDIADRVLLAIIEQIRAEAAVLYLRDSGDEILRPIATYALEGEVTPVGIGEGIPGEAMRRARPVVVRDIPSDTALRINAGFDRTVPKVIAAVPVLFGQEAIGVIMVASLRDLGEEDVLFLRVASSQFAIGLRNAKSHEQVQRLLETVREKNEQIAAQNADLHARTERIQAQHEEIQAQNEEIQAQNEEIQTQNDEMRAQNDQYRELADELRAQRAELQTRATELARANEQTNRFLSMLAHEIRSPLRPIANAVSLLEHEAPLTERLRGAIGVIARETEHIKSLLDDLADIARIGQGTLRIERAPVDIVRVVAGCVGDQQPVAQKHAITIEAALPQGPLLIDGDARRLAQIVNKLLVNAIVFSEPEKRITVALSCDDEREQATLELSAEAATVDPTLMPRLFDAFGPAGEGVPVMRGLALGLSLVKSLSELHGGCVEAVSFGVGQAARFCVRLPLCRTSVTEAKRGEAA
jgi:signal transduction histidine kinase